MRSLVLTIYDKMGWEQKASHIDRLLQTEILSFACKISVSDCKKQAKDLFYQWKNNKRLVMKICWCLTGRIFILFVQVNFLLYFAGHSILFNDLIS